MLRFLLIAGLFAPPAANAATAILNAIAESRGERVLVVEFRAVSAEGWKVSKASLFLHVASGPVPKRIRVRVAAVPAPGRPAKFRSFPAEPMPQQWVRVGIDPVLIEKMAAGNSYGIAVEQRPVRFDGLSPVFTQPYLQVEGVPATALPRHPR